LQSLKKEGNLEMRKRYSLILADPSWQYDNQQQNDPARGGITYDTLSMEQLYNIPIGKAAADDSLLVCWVTAPKLMDEYYEKYNPLSIIRHWGFRPITFIFVWVKLNKSGAGYYSGLGRYTNSNAEIAIVARKGKGLERLTKNVKQLIIAPIGKHSAKPREQYERLFSLYGNVPRIELFARDINKPPEGWDAIGLEYTPSIDIREWIKDYD
jgi:N6-adenosine-specific RNA methylase IME4